MTDATFQTPRDGGSARGPDRGPSAELCNQLDDDQDGQVDENCPCDPAVNAGQQSCYTGPVATRGQGSCRLGSQRCLGDQEFRSWGPCTGEVTPQTEIAGDRLDNDCDGETDETTPQPPPTCSNGATNYPTCTVNAGGQCLNGNTNPPACSTAPTCNNGATNYPTCTVNAGGQCLNGNTNPPACTTPPSCGNGATNYPTCTVNAGGQCLNGNTNPPACSTAPTCTNGATNYPMCTVNAGGQCLNGNTNPPACSTAPTCGNGATNYPTCTVNAGGQCLNGRVNPPTCTTVAAFALTITSPHQRFTSANSVLVSDPTLSSSPQGVTTNFSVTIKNTGNTACTPSTSTITSQYVGANATSIDCQFDFAGSAHLQPVQAGESRELGLKAFARNTAGLSYTFNASNNGFMGDLNLRCAEDASRAIVFSIGFTNAVVMSAGSCTNGAANPPACTVNAGGQCLNGNINPPACSLGAAWWVGPFGSCELGCAGAARIRAVLCIRSDGVTVAESLCAGSKPTSRETCSYQNHAGDGADLVILDERQLSPRGEFVLGAGGGMDTYFVSTQHASRGVFTITDPHGEGVNWIQFASGLVVTGFALTSNTLSLALSNGVEVNILSANRFLYSAGGRPGQLVDSLSYGDFVNYTLGVTEPLYPSTVVRRGGASVPPGGHFELRFGVNFPCVEL